MLRLREKHFFAWNRRDAKYRGGTHEYEARVYSGFLNPAKIRYLILFLNFEQLCW